ncbi:hypothetical protein BDA99DRAFT_536698 [Phascolomyces articulosus]|uniref:Uncharacterized protein n=1 Tax=Phascolomyces articulosus TaxID=60185 RepID=A0AAD5KBX6_9FUNG|nr:hypothetical protein BDA99DRAFT_536698 [Phascolomyces articulosus]
MDDTDLLWCSKVNAGIHQSFEKGTSVFLEYKKKKVNSKWAKAYQIIYAYLNGCFDVFYRLKSNSNTNSIESINEDTIVQDVLSHILKTFLPKSVYGGGLQLGFANGVILPSRKRKQRLDMEVKGRLFCSYKQRDKSKVVFLFECKFPKSVSRSNDLIKIGRAMKDCLYDAIKAGAPDDLVLTDVVTEGSRCCVFIMNLKFTAIYSMAEIIQFYIPHDHYNFGCHECDIYFDGND